MNDAAVHFGTLFMAFFAIMNPIANAPIFLGLTDELDDRDRRQVAAKSVLLAFGIVAVFVLAGREIFELFGITLPAFRIAGGILVFMVGFHLLQGQSSSVHSPTAEDNERSRDAALDMAVSPLAIPILAGPGTIATAMSYAAGASIEQMAATLLALFAVCAITFALFITGQRFTSFMGQNAIKVVSRLMGLILTVVGTQMLISGISGAVQHFGSQ